MGIEFYIFIAIISAFAGFCTYKFYTLPRERRIEALQQWLKYAVTEAEKQLGSGTGQLKLRYVYDMAAKQFPWIVKAIPFETFSLWVDEALDWMRNQIDTNKFAKEYICG